MSTSTITARRKGNPQHMLIEKVTLWWHQNTGKLGLFIRIPTPMYTILFKRSIENSQHNLISGNAKHMNDCERSTRVVCTERTRSA